MESSAVEKDALHDWIEAETRALDVVASWESLCDTYRVLEFVDPIGDSVRMEEFKWIIREMNKHLTRARRQLLSCKDSQAVRESLTEMFTPAGGTNVTGRKDLAYHKLRQMWISRMLAQLQTMEDRMKEEENGRTDYWLD